MDIIHQLENSLHKGFINKDLTETSRFKPVLLINNQEDETVLNGLLEELEQCQSFLFSVAFITESGLATLKSYLLDLQQKGVKGRILTSTYLHFNKPKVFEELMKLKNVEVRLTDLEGFHSKGYIFEQESYYSLIVGSSNLTANALKTNYEWNMKLTSHENGDVIHHFQSQFEKIWQEAIPLTQTWIDRYAMQYVPFEANDKVGKIIDFPSAYGQNAMQTSLQIKPNKMQESALVGIENVRAQEQTRGLVISATGTGKTYLAAFDVRKFQPKKMLFIVHREQILQQAKHDFMDVIGGNHEDFGILSGSKKEVEAKYLFATIQTLAKDDVLQSFVKDTFDYILIDEVHKAGAASYLKVIDYFTPKFLMGMTATPDRTDDFNIYELFDYNIAYEIRLQEALEDKMLCPFHYFGVTDFEWDGQTLDDATMLTKLVSEERMDHILEKVDYYGYSGDRVCGLIFCSRKAEAVELSEKLNERGYRTVALSGENDQTERLDQVALLEQGDLDYIITVDIFNEGIDIPSVNQVIMLRQTESSIVFIQQLGRGLRKHYSKDYVTIIDFIGNYKNNYLIPIALSGDGSQNKDNIRRHMQDTSYIKGVSTINFEEVAKKRIFKAIDETNLMQLKILRDAYYALKNRVGAIPTMSQFITHNSIDPHIIVRREGNYERFLKRLKEETPSLSEYEDKVLSMISLEFMNGKRLHEVILLEMLLQHRKVTLDAYLASLQVNGCYVDEATIDSVKRMFSLSFFTKTDITKYGGKPIVHFTSDGEISFDEAVQTQIDTHDYFLAQIEDVLQTARLHHVRYESSQPLTLHEKYTKKDVCRLLNWHKDEKGTMYGYRTKHHTCPIFITYHKQDVEESINYGDKLLSPETLHWFTKNNRTLRSKEVQEIIQAEQNNIDIHLFVKKDDDEGTDFYYLGEALPDDASIEETTMMSKGKELPVVKMNLQLHEPVSHSLFHYLTHFA